MKYIFYLTSILLAYTFTKESVAQNSAVDSLIKVLKVAKEDTNKVNALVALSDEFENSNPDTAIIFCKQALSMAEKLNWATGIGKSCHQLGRIFGMHGNFSLSFEYYQKSLETWEKIERFNSQEKNSSLIDNKIKTIGNIGIVYQDQGNNPKAMAYYFKALKMAEETGNKRLISYQLSNIGSFFAEQNNDSKALTYLNRALKIEEELGNIQEISSILGNIGIVYLNLEDFEKALDYYQKALKVSENAGNKISMALWLGNIGLVHDEQGDYSKALDYFFEALKITEVIGNKDGIAYLLGTIGAVYCDLKEYKKAEEYLKRSIAINKSIGSLKQLMQDEKYLSDVYSETAQYQLSYIHFGNYIEARDSIHNEENSRKILSTELNYEFEKKEAIQNAQHEKEVLTLEVENKIQKQLRLFLFIVIALALLLLFFVNRAYRNKKKHADFLALEDSRKELLLEEVHHRINNNLQIISSLLTLQANSAKDERLFEYLKESQNRIQALATLHGLLYQNNSPLEININEYINKVLDFHRDVAGTLSANIVVEMQVPSVKFPANLAVPLALIINELVTNSLKYAFLDRKEGKINVCLVQNQVRKKNWNLIISDNGTGLPVEENMRKDSLGLRLVTILSRQIGATFNTVPSQGATFEIIFEASK